MTTISAKSLLASSHVDDPTKRIDTFLCRYPRWIHAEGRTHRLLNISEDFAVSVPTPSLMEDSSLSRNASSSRAIPVEKLIQDVLDDPAVPLFWGKNQKGMKADEETNADVFIGDLAFSNENAWLTAMDAAIDIARAFDSAGYHKQIVNRLLEPFSHITVVVTGTQWSNFLHLRDHEDAEPHIRLLAKAIKKAYDSADVQILNPGEWHLPMTDYTPNLELTRTTEQDFLKLSVARCASTSYKTVDGFDMSIGRAVALHDKLVGMDPLHASPCEHQAKADIFERECEGPYGEWRIGRWQNERLSGNLGPGWVQYRKTLPGECR